MRGQEQTRTQQSDNLNCLPWSRITYVSHAKSPLVALYTTKLHIKKMRRSEYLLLLYGSQNKPRLFPYTTLTDWIYNRDGVCLLRGTDWVFIYRQFNIQQFYVLPTQCIYVFYVDLRTNSDYFPIQH